MNNPFEYGKAVSGYQFYDRSKSCDELAAYLRDGSTNVVLYAPRRYGKTSMVVRVLERLKAEGLDCLLFDISKVATVEKFCESYATALHAVYGRLSEVAGKIAQYLLHLHPTISVGTKGVSIRPPSRAFSRCRRTFPTMCRRCRESPSCGSRDVPTRA